MGLYTTRRSILAVLAGLNDDVLGEYVVADYAAAAGRKVEEGRGSRRRGTGDEITNDFAALPDLNVDAGPEPFLDLFGIAKLAEGNDLHDLNVTQNVSHCQKAVPGTDRFFHRQRAAWSLVFSPVRAEDTGGDFGRLGSIKGRRDANQWTLAEFAGPIWSSVGQPAPHPRWFESMASFRC